MKLNAVNQALVELTYKKLRDAELRGACGELTTEERRLVVIEAVEVLHEIHSSESTERLLTLTRLLLGEPSP